MLTTENLIVNILCFTEHWLPEVKMNVLNIDCFKFVRNFNRSHSTSGGSCIFTRNTVEAKEVGELGNEKVFEISAVELSDIGTILACIKVSSKGKCLILCGDLNVNFLQYSSKLLDLQNLLLMNNLINIVKSPMKISNHSISLN